jgi:hypothetical protein
MSFASRTTGGGSPDEGRRVGLADDDPEIAAVPAVAADGVEAGALEAAAVEADAVEADGVAADGSEIDASEANAVDAEALSGDAPVADEEPGVDVWTEAADGRVSPGGVSGGSMGSFDAAGDSPVFALPRLAAARPLAPPPAAVAALALVTGPPEPYAGG